MTGLFVSVTPLPVAMPPPPRPALLLMTGLSVSVAAQWVKMPAAGIPRGPDGKVNLSAPAPRLPDGIHPTDTAYGPIRAAIFIWPMSPATQYTNIEDADSKEAATAESNSKSFNTARKGTI